MILFNLVVHGLIHLVPLLSKWFVSFHLNVRQCSWVLRFVPSLLCLDMWWYVNILLFIFIILKYLINILKGNRFIQYRLPRRLDVHHEVALRAVVRGPYALRRNWRINFLLLYNFCRPGLLVKGVARWVNVILLGRLLNLYVRWILLVVELRGCLMLVLSSWKNLAESVAVVRVIFIVFIIVSAVVSLSIFGVFSRVMTWIFTFVLRIIAALASLTTILLNFETLFKLLHHFNHHHILILDH